MFLLAVSGSGKSSSMFAALSTYFGTYVLCTPRASQQNKRFSKHEFNESFAVFDEAVDAAIAPLPTPREKTDEALRLAHAFVAAHLVVLWLFLSTFPVATPYHCLQFQLSAEGIGVVTDVFCRRLSRLKQDAAKGLCKALRTPLRNLATAHGALTDIVLAVDELEGATGAAAGDVFLSRNEHVGQSLVSPLARAVTDLVPCAWYHQIYGGTGSNEARSKSLTSDIGKEWGSGKIRGASFPVASSESVAAILGTVTGLSRQEIMSIPEVPKYLVDARFRLTTLAADKFRAGDVDAHPKARLAHAVGAAVARHKDSLVESIEQRVAGGTSDDVKAANLAKLHRVYLASSLTGGEMPFVDPDLAGWVSLAWTRRGSSASRRLLPSKPLRPTSPKRWTRGTAWPSASLKASRL